MDPAHFCKQDCRCLAYLDNHSYKHSSPMCGCEISGTPHGWRKSLLPNSQFPSAEDSRERLVGVSPLPTRAAGKGVHPGLGIYGPIVSEAGKRQGHSR